VFEFGSELTAVDAEASLRFVVDEELDILWAGRRKYEKESKPRERVRVESCRPELVPADASALQAKRHRILSVEIT